MNKLNDMLFLIVMLTLLSSCNNSKNDKKNDPGSDTTQSTSERRDTTKGSIPPINTDGVIDRDPACRPNPDRGSVPIATIAQQASFWCWAASGEMVMERLRGNINQCDEANERLRRTDCCNSARPNDCDDGGWPEFEKFGFLNDRTTNSELPWELIKRQIDCRKTPFCVTWRWIEGGGHMMVVSAYRLLNGDSLVKIRDPLPVDIGSTRWVSYSEYVSGPGYTHWDDLYNVRKTE